MILSLPFSLIWQLMWCVCEDEAWWTWPIINYWWSGYNEVFIAFRLYWGDNFFLISLKHIWQQETHQQDQQRFLLSHSSTCTCGQAETCFLWGGVSKLSGTFCLSVYFWVVTLAVPTSEQSVGLDINPVDGTLLRHGCPEGTKDEGEGGALHMELLCTSPKRKTAENWEHYWKKISLVEFGGIQLYIVVLPFRLVLEWVMAPCGFSEHC